MLSTIWEEGPTELVDYSDEEEDDILNNEDNLGTNLTSRTLKKFQTKKTPGAKLRQPNSNSELTMT